MASTDPNSRVEITEGAVGKLIVAVGDFPAGTTMTESVCSAAEVLSAPTMYTVQVAPGKHVDVKTPLMYTAHSCAPSGKIVVSEQATGGWTVQVESTRDLSKGEWVTFDYNSTEWDMQSPFDCACGAPSCRKSIKGAKYLSKEDAAALLPSCSGVIAVKLRETTLSSQ